MRTYNIDEINKIKSGTPWKWPVIFSLLSLLITVGIIALAVSASDDLTASVSADSDAVLLENESGDNAGLGDILRQRTVADYVNGNELKTYSISEIRQLDVSQPSGVTVADLTLVTRGNFKGLESAFWQAEQDYGINCLFLMAIGANESGFGTVCFRKNNMFGFGRKSYATKEANIDAVASTLAHKYLTPGASCYKGKTIDAVHIRYAASPVWDDHVAKYMVKFYDTIAPYHNAAIEKLK